MRTQRMICLIARPGDLRDSLAALLRSLGIAPVMTLGCQPPEHREALLGERPTLVVWACDCSADEAAAFAHWRADSLPASRSLFLSHRDRSTHSDALEAFDLWLPIGCDIERLSTTIIRLFTQQGLRHARTSAPHIAYGR